ncbi:MAG: peptide MFS transporter [Myxococcales bacterium FL481]|nr:MAG: peptide MFS transporter [Myxococcales bacterium FL481]
MHEDRPSLLKQIRSYPRAFWVANIMEIFERLSWYGWFTVMALYVTSPVENGGLGFSTEQRGILQGVVPFLLYLFPVITGALADRFGFRRMFIISFLVMIVAYYLLGQFTTFGSFFVAFLLVAVGAALFKPVVVGTVATVTTAANSVLGFGIFYMMVNLGGFLGPLVAGRVRGVSWELVFIACAGWAAINLLIAVFFYRDPPQPETSSEDDRPSILESAAEVLGNIRFFIAVGGVLIALMAAGSELIDSFDWPTCLVTCVVWIALNFAYDAVLRSRPTRSASALAEPMKCSNWRFAVFLLLMSGFWTSYNQIFYTMTEYIRDFVDTRPLVEVAESFDDDATRGTEDGWAASVATVSESERKTIARELNELVERDRDGELDDTALQAASRKLLQSKLRITATDLGEEIRSHSSQSATAAPGDTATATATAGADSLADRLIDEGRQFNPEYIVAINFGAIVVFQLIVSTFVGRLPRFTAMILGMVVAGIGVGLPAFAGGAGMVGLGGSIWIVALSLLIFSFGEMMASPTSQEYVGRIAPDGKKALYMGYYFVSMALGNLFGGILSGQLYGTLARDEQRPELMWAIFGGLMLAVAGAFLLYNRLAVPKTRPVAAGDN